MSNQDLYASRYNNIVFQLVVICTHIDCISSNKERDIWGEFKQNTCLLKTFFLLKLDRGGSPVGPKKKHN